MHPLFFMLKLDAEARKMYNFNNPIYNPYNNVYPQMKSPEQVQKEMQDLMNRYQNIIGQSQQQTLPTPPQNFNGGLFHYVNDYSEVEKAQVNMNGTAELFIGEGIMWSKKLINGQPYVDAFNFTKINNVGQPKEEEPTNTQDKQENASGGLELSDIVKTFSKEIEKINKRLDSIQKVEVIDNESND